MTKSGLFPWAGIFSTVDWLSTAATRCPLGSAACGIATSGEM